MFHYLKGALALTGPNYLVVECGGVGYRCHTSDFTLKNLPPKESAVQVFTHLHVREDIMDLYGFATERELLCFEMLLTVSGVGPKAALAVLSALSPERFALSIASGDFRALTAAQGVGTKLAQRIVLELKDKMKKEQLSAPLPAAGEGEEDPGDALREARNALQVLGYTRGEAAAALRGLDPACSLEELIRQALKKLMR